MFLVAVFRKCSTVFVNPKIVHLASIRTQQMRRIPGGNFLNMNSPTNSVDETKKKTGPSVEDRAGRNQSTMDCAAILWML